MGTRDLVGAGPIFYVYILHGEVYSTGFSYTGDRAMTNSFKEIRADDPHNFSSMFVRASLGVQDPHITVCNAVFDRPNVEKLHVMEPGQLRRLAEFALGDGWRTMDVPVPDEMFNEDGYAPVTVYVTNNKGSVARGTCMKYRPHAHHEERRVWKVDGHLGDWLISHWRPVASAPTQPATEIVTIG